MAARKLHNLIYATIANCCVFIIVCSVALGTNKWFSGETKEVDAGAGPMKVTMSYGLFSGTKSTPISATMYSYDLKIVCQGTQGCMFSCGYNAEQRKIDIENLLNDRGQRDSTVCRDTSSRSIPHSQPLQAGGKEPVLINFAFYLLTIMCIGLGMIFDIVAGILALYNTYRTPIQPVLSVLGLYIWNGISAAFVLLGMIMWGVEFATRLRKDAAISNTLSGDYDSEGMGSLGISYWILILPILCSLANIFLLLFRSWKIVNREKNNVIVMKEKLESGDILLF